MPASIWRIWPLTRSERSNSVSRIATREGPLNGAAFLRLGLREAGCRYVGFAGYSPSERGKINFSFLYPQPYGSGVTSETNVTKQRARASETLKPPPARRKNGFTALPPRKSVRVRARATGWSGLLLWCLHLMLYIEAKQVAPRKPQYSQGDQTCQLHILWAASELP